MATGLTLNESGFESAPQGALFAQHLDFRSSIGIAYERCIHYCRDFHFHSRWTLAFPRGSSQVAFTLKREERVLTLTSKEFLVMPPGIVHTQGSTTTVYDVIAIMVKNDAAEALAQCPIGPTVLPRTPLLAALVDRAFSALIVEKRKPATVDWILNAIIHEVPEIVYSHTQSGDSGSALKPAQGGVALALTYIESNLFSPLSVEKIASHAHFSVPSLFRRFREALGTTPLEYVRKRRLEEAHLLLATGRHTVQEVCFLVGYEDPVSFSKSFKACYGQAPSLLIPKVAAEAPSRKRES